MVKRIAIATGVFMAIGAGASLAEDKKNGAADDAAFEFTHVSCTGAENEIRIIVDGVVRPQGRVTADLFPNKEDGFLRGRGRIEQVSFAAKTPQTKFCMRAPESGQFAIAVYHDENANGDFDKNGIGLPAEPWGISNNPKIRFGPPSVDKALFDVTPENGAKITISLN
ncbi:DUF2141 domain-containing protein [Hyphococcus sp.]|uniref:DUF2141 domain-containing protein n=1 Tax=Hyphococcus sp. TaxID=2038636 RepID=UPI003CCC1FFD